MMNGKQRDATQLEAELLRLNTLVRERRKQLARLEKCPNKDCPCRFVWREHVEKRLAGQVGEIRRRVRSQAAKLIKAKGKLSRSPAIGGRRGSVGGRRKG
jgi:hypothetical protein